MRFKNKQAQREAQDRLDARLKEAGRAGAKRSVGRIAEAAEVSTEFVRRHAGRALSFEGTKAEAMMRQLGTTVSELWGDLVR